MKRQKNIYLSVVLILVTFFLSSSVPIATAKVNKDKVTWPKGPSICAKGAIVMESSTGLVLYDKNMKDKMYPASITKIMTALVAIENCTPNDIVTLSHDALFCIEPGSSILGGTAVGERLTVQQCLYAILLESANDISNAIAEHVAGSNSAFADMMNQKAKRLGCVNTHFVNPHGLHDSNHYTCAYDMALITREAMKNETFRKIFGSRSYQIPPTNKQKETRYLRNHHKFILQEKYRYDDCIGGKTGYTTDAKNTLVTIAKRGDMELICVVMRDDGAVNEYGDTKKLLDFGFDNFSIYQIKNTVSSDTLPESPLFTKFSPLLNETKSPIVPDENGYVILPNAASLEDTEKTVSFYHNRTSMKKGSVIGQISYSYQDKYVGGADILVNDIDPIFTLSSNGTKISSSDLLGTSKINSLTKTKKSGSILPIVFGVIAGIILLLITLYYILVERPRLKRMRSYYRRKAHRNRYPHNDYFDL